MTFAIVIVVSAVGGWLAGWTLARIQTRHLLHDAEILLRAANETQELATRMLVSQDERAPIDIDERGGLLTGALRRQFGNPTKSSGGQIVSRPKEGN